MAYMKISVRFRRETRHYAFTLAGSKVRLNNLFQEIQIPGLCRFFVQLFHILLKFLFIANNLANI